MPPNFEDLRALSIRRWQGLSQGDKPWIRVGTALCGKAAGADRVIAALTSELEQRNVGAIISEVGCLGPCYAEPLVDVVTLRGPRVVYGGVTPEQVAEIFDSHIVNGKPVAAYALGTLGDDRSDDIPRLADHPMMKAQHRIALRNAGHVDPCDIRQYIANDGYAALYRALTEMTPDQVREEVSKSGLRGRGGAAFPTGTKWNFLAGAKDPVKYILVNCEEGDPGAFNDKGILESDPHSLIEGVILAGYATGATMGYVFIRHGHDGPIDRTWCAIDQARELGILGQNILGSSFSFDIEVALTGDSYVAGEETALMESIEGKRAMPRYRPPFPAQVGLFGKPSNINNVKTLAYVPQIVLRGSDWFAGIGRERSTGTAILCLSGDLTYTGMAEVPMGMTLRQVVDDVAGGVPGGKKLKLLQTGGPLGGVLSSDDLDIPLDFDAMAQTGAILGSGGIIAASEESCVVDLTRVLIAFCQYESCGKCFPCRTGMTHLLEVLERICRLEGRSGDLELMRTVGQNMQAGSLCGHGQLGFNPVSSALRYFREEFEQHLRDKTCAAGKCPSPWYSPDGARR